MTRAADPTQQQLEAEREVKRRHDTKRNQDSERRKYKYLHKKVAISQRRQIVDAFKVDGCQVCGEKFLGCIEFHHLDPKQKDAAVCELVANCKPIPMILREIAKCIVVCRNCHAKIHSSPAEQ